jgi:hypothetical protein
MTYDEDICRCGRQMWVSWWCQGKPVFFCDYCDVEEDDDQ